jgi:hypothetical protein
LEVVGQLEGVLRDAIDAEAVDDLEAELEGSDRQERNGSVLKVRLAGFANVLIFPDLKRV